jgi:hypothetical protein
MMGMASYPETEFQRSPGELEDVLTGGKHSSLNTRICDPIAFELQHI